jgi:hypothetical protein
MQNVALSKIDSLLDKLGQLRALAESDPGVLKGSAELVRAEGIVSDMLSRIEDAKPERDPRSKIVAELCNDASRMSLGKRPARTYKRDSLAAAALELVRRDAK